jgi:2-polyprenyl-3-methyl-5-hydroxy-6-metoxy-1,4-benzoquinol methylase
MNYSDFYKTQGHSYEEYERSHKPRLDFLVEDLKLNELKDKNIADIGCGLGFIYNRLSPDIQKNYYGYDGADSSNAPFNYEKVDLDNFKCDKHNFFDIALCFETLEHLTNPYNCLFEIKNILKENHLLYISIPHPKTQHNTIYPGLIYPVENFVKFLEQMAFEIIDYKIHDKSFYQNVFIVKNLNWHQSKMLWHRNEEIFRNIPPHISINI